MDFRIANTFTDSLARQSGDEQMAVKTTAVDLQLNPAHPRRLPDCLVAKLRPGATVASVSF